MTNMDWERDMVLTQLDDIGIGFREGKPWVASPKKRSRLFVVTVNLFALAMFMTAAVVVSLVWSRVA